MQSSKYAQKVPVIIAEMNEGREEDETYQADQLPENKIYAYPFEGGGIVLTSTPIDEDQPEAPIVESGEFQTDQRPLPRKDPPYFLYFMLLLLLFIILDSADTGLTALFKPTAYITVYPQTQALTTTATFAIGTGPGDVQGRVLPALTISQSQTVPATGRGHQDAKNATGTLTFFNGQLQTVAIPAGSTFTTGNGVHIVTDETATIPAADPTTNPPTFGQIHVSAHAVQPGASGNIQAYTLNGSCCSGSVIVKNLAPFAHGQDARDFTFVTKGDYQQASSVLTSHVQQSEQGALSGQLQPGETLTIPTCKTSVLSNHKSGDEAQSLTVTVSATCKAVVYDQNSLQSAALRFVQSRLTKLNSHYQLLGTIHITVRSTAMQTSSPTLTALLHGVWVYQINEAQVKALVTGKPRLQAIQLLSLFPGVQRLSISGISDNQPLPDDVNHVHVLILVQE